MYSFAQRDDMEILEEPLYAHFLRESGIERDHKADLLRRREGDGRKVIDWMMRNDSFQKPIVLIKEMPHHMVGNLPLDFILQMDRIMFVTRDPRDQLISYFKVVAEPTMAGIGTKASYDMYKMLEENNIHPPVIDTNELVMNPETMLRKICEYLDIPFQPQMMEWESGGRKEDMLPGSNWNQNLHQSTGFTTKFEGEKKALPEKLQELYEEAKPYYEYLHERRIKV